MGTQSIKTLKQFPYTWYVKRVDGTVKAVRVMFSGDQNPELVKKVWREGPRGGVKVTCDFSLGAECGYIGYITTNEEAMKEFMWAKLSAEAV
jgi:coenzyme F420-reducing hydrogenase delta subunit